MNEHDILIWVSIICIASELLILCFLFKKIERELSIVRERVESDLSTVREHLEDIFFSYREIDDHYKIILARTNELGNLLSDLTKEYTKCNDIAQSKLAELEKLVTDIDDCMNSVNEAVVPVIQSDNDILVELKEKILTETEKETSNDN